MDVLEMSKSLQVLFDAQESMPNLSLTDRGGHNLSTVGSSRSLVLGECASSIVAGTSENISRAVGQGLSISEPETDRDDKGGEDVKSDPLEKLVSE